jgi:hypothetical protein
LKGSDWRNNTGERERRGQNREKEDKKRIKNNRKMRRREIPKGNGTRKNEKKKLCRWKIKTAQKICGIKL